MEYKAQPASRAQFAPRIIIHGGAGNITPKNLRPDLYATHRQALLTIVSLTHVYMTTPKAAPYDAQGSSNALLPSALETATFAVELLENNALFNSGHGAVFTRDGINELEASVMVSRGFAKRGVGVTGLRHVKNPIRLAKALLEHGQEDLAATHVAVDEADLNVPSAQGHELIHGSTAEILAKRYGLEMVEPDYFFTQNRWDEHIKSLEKERSGEGIATWSAEEYLPQGTCGAVALDSDGVICAATSTGGLTNKLTGRIGDTPIVGAGFWAEEFEERGDPAAALRRPGLTITLSDSLKGLMADCLPTPFLYTPAPSSEYSDLVTTRSIGASGTGNGDSFIRIAAVRTVGAIARFGGVSGAEALTRVTGPDGELQKSAGDRWNRTGEGQGGMIGVEGVVVRDPAGRVVERRSEILQDFNCRGMFRAWIDEKGDAVVRVWKESEEILGAYVGEGQPESVRQWAGEKAPIVHS
ncbi:N-terminal nucleophile aminohydrolase [Thozetella sp. PMI_491]|nr:N-terminal nucleophile aminohydrolase [Thozetella sp. PMI_491]